jgi:predicted  nucleic acid-binding Zn-ribbon protein
LTVFDELLAVQSLDTKIDQLRHREATLPERAELIARQRELAALEARAGKVQTARDAVSRTERRLEDEIALVRAKVDQEDKRLYSGAITAPKELQALQDEIAALGRRQSDLEDAELEAMVEAEPLEADLASIATDRDAIDAAAIALTAAIAEAEVTIGAELARVLEERAKAVAPVPADLLATYDSLRLAHDGIAVARLIGNRCDGCHLTLSAVEVDEIRHEPPDAEVHCSECGRLLVR